MPCRLPVTVSAIGPGAEQALIPDRTIRLQLQWADPSRKWRLLLIIDTRTDLHITRPPCDSRSRGSAHRQARGLRYQFTDPCLRSPRELLGDKPILAETPKTVQHFSLFFGFSRAWLVNCSGSRVGCEPMNNAGDTPASTEKEPASPMPATTIRL